MSAMIALPISNITVGYATVVPAGSQKSMTAITFTKKLAVGGSAIVGELIGSKNKRYAPIIPIMIKSSNAKFHKNKQINLNRLSYRCWNALSIKK